MIFWMVVKVALKSLLANKLRSVLAMLGIIIGVGAVISMLALGAGAQQAVLSRFSAMGADVLIVRPAQRGTGGVMSGTQQNLTLEDGAALLEQVPGIRQIAPVVNGRVQVKYMAKNTRTSLVGTSVTYLPARNFEVDRGRPFTEQEVDGTARVAVIGPVTADNLFGVMDPVGQMVKLNGISFRVLGILKSKGDQGFFNPDDQVIIPYTTAMKQVLGLTYLSEIDIQAQAGANLTQVQEAVIQLMRKRHRVQPDMPDDVNIRNQAEILENISSASRTFTMLLGGIAGISLLVGGIGIMNIMLVTVTERTREIGVRKAVGAKERDILWQFLIESLLMSGLGGLIGVAAGVGGAAVLGRVMDNFTTIVQMQSVLMSLIFSGAVGVFFGFYPAWRASGLDPIEALRYE